MSAYNKQSRKTVFGRQTNVLQQPHDNSGHLFNRVADIAFFSSGFRCMTFQMQVGNWRWSEQRSELLSDGCRETWKQNSGHQRRRGK